MRVELLLQLLNVIQGKKYFEHVLDQQSVKQVFLMKSEFMMFYLMPEDID